MLRYLKRSRKVQFTEYFDLLDMRLEMRFREESTCLIISFLFYSEKDY